MSGSKSRDEEGRNDGNLWGLKQKGAEYAYSSILSHGNLDHLDVFAEETSLQLCSIRLMTEHAV